MKNWLLTFLLLYSLNSWSQNENNFFFKEIVANFNRTNLSDAQIDNKCGFGLGTYGWANNNFKAKFLLGIEYNYTAQFHESEFNGKSENLTDITYLIHNFSIPIGIKYYLNNAENSYLNMGAFGDIVISYHQSGISHFSNNQTTKIEKAEKLPGVIYGIFIGIGRNIEINKLKFNVNFDYKFGLNPITSSTSHIKIYNQYARFLIGIPINL